PVGRRVDGARPGSRSGAGRLDRRRGLARPQPPAARDPGRHAGQAGTLTGGGRGLLHRDRSGRQRGRAPVAAAEAGRPARAVTTAHERVTPRPAGACRSGLCVTPARLQRPVTSSPAARPRSSPAVTASPGAPGWRAASANVPVTTSHAPRTDARAQHPRLAPVLPTAEQRPVTAR